MFGIVTTLKQMRRNVQLPPNFGFNAFIVWSIMGLIPTLAVGSTTFIDHPVGLVWMVGLLAIMLYMDEP